MSAHIDALKKAILNNLTAGDVPIGLHQFDDVVELHVHGTAKQGDMQYVKPTATLPLLAILALVIAKAGIMGPHILGLIREAAAEAQAKGEKVGDYLETTKKAIRTVQEELIDGMTLLERRGTFRGVLEVKVLSVH